MQLLNATGMPASLCMGMRPDGRELLVVVVKGTFSIPQRHQSASRADEQKPLITADQFSGEPGLSAPLYEADFAPYKPRCDVLLNGSAYAPGGRPVSRVEVTLRLASLFKSFAVTGNRYWESGNIAISPGYPGLFERMPISYDCAFGGVDTHHEDEHKHTAWTHNPVGLGYHYHLSREWVDGSPMPNTEELRRPVNMPNGSYAPMALGHIGRGWESRRRLAGTYDDAWLGEHAPFLPPDFDDRYYQAAPEDQQINHLQGGERVFLENLTPQGQTSFDLPSISVPVDYFYRNGDVVRQMAVVDTVMLEPDEGLFTLTWRTHIPLKRNIFEIQEVLAGRKSRAWWRARELGKVYYPSLAHLADAKRAARVEED
ncbi:MAG: DUF2169 domain-containing protein [Candidatus Thiodiazotropha sp.]